MSTPSGLSLLLSWVGQVSRTAVSQAMVICITAPHVPAYPKAHTTALPITPALLSSLPWAFRAFLIGSICERWQSTTLVTTIVKLINTHRDEHSPHTEETSHVIR